MYRLVFLFIGCGPALLLAGELPPPAKHKVDFATEIKPLFATHCIDCHGPKKQKAELRLDMKGNAIRAKESPIVPGNSAGSPLIEAVAGLDDDLVMPPKGERLTAAQVGLLRAWIDQGAVWPDEHSVKVDDGSTHWAVQAVQRPVPPQVVNAAWIRNDVDLFILAKLEEKNLAPSAEANRRTLIRRLSYDLHGLPPTPERTAAFVQAKDPRAYEQLVDEFLASPHYGERWARHWLDIAHYADTHGFERDMRRDNAWRYRDYVIQALNADKPYDRFLMEQIAGDVLAPQDRDAVIATGFLAAGPWDYVGQVETPSPMLKRQARGDDLDDMVTQVMTASVGLTVNCARCHDHKLDPILQREYYSLWAVFAGLKRSERPVSREQQRAYEEKLAALKAEKDQVTLEISKRTGKPVNLADIVGGGNGFGSARKGHGIDPATGKALPDKQDLVKNTKANQYVRGPFACVDGVAIPDGGKDGVLEVPISSTGLKITGLPATSVQAWDAIRHGPGNRYENTRLGEIDYSAEGHSLLSLHANALITFDLNAIRELNGAAGLRFTATLGLGSKSDVGNADFHLYVDGVLKARHSGVTKMTPPVALNIELPPAARFLTLISTEGINGISHDQIFLGDPLLHLDPAPAVTDDARQKMDALKLRVSAIEKEMHALPPPDKFYGVNADKTEPVRVLKRGNAEDAGDEVLPATIAWVKALPAQLAADNTAAEGQRRLALAQWIAAPRNPLTRRVAVNRLWHHHFGQGLVTTPSDFGRGGDKPSHPELLDWLADELLQQRWSLKTLHKTLVMSATYRQVARSNPKAVAIDAQNRLLWRYAPRRADAEALRDYVLAVTGSLNTKMGGPGFQDFKYKEEYAPVYSYISPDAPELWRRSIYRFVVRTTPHPLLSTFDCPNPANLAPARVSTTTALQALALSNNEFMLLQAQHFAARVNRDAGAATDAQVLRAFELALNRPPAARELTAAQKLSAKYGLFAVCRMLLNSNEFLYVE